MKSSALAGLALVALTIGAFAAAPPVESDEAKSARLLVAALSDRDWTVRDAAERRLVAMGLPALPLVRRAAQSPDPEVRRRVLKLLPVLEHAALVMPKRFTFSVVDRPITDVIAELKKATGYKIESNLGTIINVAGPGGVIPPGERKFTYHFKSATYWEILDQLSRDVGINVQQNWGDDIIRFYQGGPPPSHVGYSGQFRYAATNFQMYRNVDLTRPKSDVEMTGRSDSLTLNMTVSAEPQMPFLGVEQPRVELARDDRKGSMLPTPSVDEATGMMGGRFISRRYYGGGYKQPQVQVSVSLAPPSLGAKRLAHLKGVVPVTLLVAQKPVVVSDEILKAKDLKRTIEGVEFHIQNVKTMPNNQYQVQFTVVNKANPGDYNFLNTLYQRIELFDDKGTKFQNGGSSWGGGPAGMMNLTLTFVHYGGTKIGPPAKFVYHHWETKMHEIPFEFKDLPLP